MKKNLRSVFANPLSLIGAVVAVFNAGLIAFLIIVEMLTKHPKPYADVIIFIILPVVVFCGLVLVVIGIVRERRRQETRVSAEPLLIIDFNNPRHRTMAVVLGGGFVLLSLLYAFSSFKAYEFVESDKFCGMLCHRVMGPENIAHSFSHHAEVACVECHVGAGAKHFFLSKLNGSRQLYALVFNKYERPIPVPVHNLRPSEDVCETCHGPKYLPSERLLLKTHFLPDRGNTKWAIDLLLKMGTGRIETDKPPKIHWHYTVAKEIRYVTKDPKRMVIPWIQVTGFDGKFRTYQSTQVKISEEELKGAEKRLMDCVDCHNRAGHPYRHPASSVNAYLQGGSIDPSLPEVKSIAVKALENAYTSRQEAREGIRHMITDFYQKTHPDVASSKKVEIEQAVTAVQRIYDRNYDPAMKVSWKHFPDNAGHMYSLGCFRCHDGNHVSKDGKVLSRDCSICHLLITHEIGPSREQAVLKLAAYPHPVDIGDSYKQMNCSDCHGVVN